MKNFFPEKKKMKTKISIAAFFLFMTAHSALAAGAAPEAPEWRSWLWKIVNFAILVTIIVVFLKKPMADYLKARTEAIKKGLDDARKARETAEAALREVQEKLKSKDFEIEQILKSAKESGVAERDAILKETGRMSQNIDEHADTYISFELKKAKDAIRKEAVILALELAEKKLEQKMTPGEQKKLIEDAVSRLEGKS